MIDIEDQRALELLHSRFAHAGDRRDYALLRSLYTDDAIEHHGAFTGGVDDFVVWLAQVHESFENATHVMTNLLFSVDGDSAESEGRGCTYLRLKGERPSNMIVINRHFDRYARVGGRWLFSRRALCIDWVQRFPPEEEELDLVKASPVGAMSQADPVYREVPQLIAALRVDLPPRQPSAWERREKR